MKPNEPSDYEPPMNSNRRRPSGSNNQNNKPKINDLGRNVPNSNKPRSGVPSFKGPIRNNVNNGNKPNQIPRSQPHNKDYKQNSENNQNYYNQILNRGNKPNFEENNYNQNNFASNKPNEKFDNYYEDSYKPGLKGSNNDGSGNKFFTKKRFFLFLKIFAVCFIVGILAAVGIVYNAISSYNKSDLKLSDEQMALDNLTTSIYDENEELIQKLSNDSNKEFVSIDLIQPELQEAFIALEDERFKEHNGVDYFGFARGVITTILGSQSGGSTLTMQLVRNITQDKESTYKRKIIEMYRATEMEKSMSKKKILENYLNIIHMGADNDDKNGNGEVDEDEVPATVNGVKSAALRFYEKDISEGDKLTILECAVLAGITQTPNYYMPRDKENQKHILDKAKNVILPKMYEQGYITKAEYEKAKSETIEFKKGNLNIGKSTEQSYFVDAVIDQAAAELSEESGITEVAARSQVYKKGYKIYTTFDKSIQEKMDSVFLNEAKYFSSSLVEKSDEEKKDAAEGTSIFKGKNYVSTGTSDEDDLEYNVQAGMVIMDPNTGFVKALYGGRGKKDGIPSNYATGSTGNGIGSGGRMPGSSFKPVAAYAPALESGLINPGSVIDDVPVYYSRDKNVRYPKNYVADKHYGMLSAREAVATSNNVIAAKLFLQLKDKYKTEAVETLEKLNLYDSKTANAEATKKAREKNPDADEQDDYNNGSISIALGGHINSTPLKMAAAYCSFANKGVYNEPLFYT
ncbi:MAG: transglycosylase domain-containing protein, partial [Clostridiales bacterium]